MASANAVLPLIGSQLQSFAAQLLPIFLKEPRGWGALTFSSRPAHPSHSLSQHFTKWRSGCPRELQPFITKLAAVFEVKA